MPITAVSGFGTVLRTTMYLRLTLAQNHYQHSDSAKSGESYPQKIHSLQPPSAILMAH